MWEQHEATALCRLLEEHAPKFGYHVALTGGLLYKYGPRDDCDILFYSIRQNKNPNQIGLTLKLAALGFSDITNFGWLFKAKYNGKPVDIFFPEAPKTDADGASGGHL